jgi:crotonobetainyl-CoA:carnitine CoA-transferase CaiB-like acyl-CoA transferase
MKINWIKDLPISKDHLVAQKLYQCEDGNYIIVSAADDPKNPETCIVSFDPPHFITSRISRSCEEK